MLALIALMSPLKANQMRNLEDRNNEASFLFSNNEQLNIQQKFHKIKHKQARNHDKVSFNFQQILLFIILADT